jgi:two-component system LytT family response regulator
MLKAVVIEDEIRTRDTIVSIIDNQSSSFEVIGVAGNLKNAVQTITSLKPDIVLFDVELSDGTAFDVLKKIENIDFQIIFITAHEGYALQAIKLSAYDYILKPFNSHELIEILENVRSKIINDKKELSFEILLKHIDGSDNNKIVLKTLTEIHIVNVNDIVHCKADLSYTHFIMCDGSKLTVSGNLKNYEDLLSNHNFIRVHHSYLVNVNHIKKFKRLGSINVYMDDGSIIPVSTRKKEQLIKTLNRL